MSDKEKQGRRMRARLEIYRERKLTCRICLGILKTDQWKPNSKMNQGKFPCYCHPQVYLQKGEEMRGRWKEDRECGRLTFSDHGYIRPDRESKPRRPSRFIYRMSHLRFTSLFLFFQLLHFPPVDRATPPLRLETPWSDYLTHARTATCTRETRTNDQADQYRQDRPAFNKKAAEYTKQVSHCLSSMFCLREEERVPSIPIYSVDRNYENPS